MDGLGITVGRFFSTFLINISNKKQNQMVDKHKLNQNRFGRYGVAETLIEIL